MKRHALNRIAIAALISGAFASSAVAQSTTPSTTTPPAENRNQRQEARQETRQENRQESREDRQQRQDDRQDNRQEQREQRQEARQKRIEQRMSNRSQYFSTESNADLDAWITRNNVPPLQRAAKAAGTAVNAAERALNTATNIANNAAANANANSNADAGADARYGYTNPNPNKTNDWFYDYYSYAPTYYSSGEGNTKNFATALRYYDLNNDGLYDSLGTHRDSDNNGSFDSYDRVDFFTADKDESSNSQSNSDQSDQYPDSPEDTRMHSVSGKIFATKVAKVNGQNNLIARLSNATSTTGAEDITLVDLGPTNIWKSLQYKAGDALSASGSVERIGEKQILIASTASIGDEEQTTISRSGPAIEGQVVDVTTTEIRGKKHTLAVIATESSRQIVDMGPADQLKVKLEPETKISVRGIPVRMRNHSIVLAESATINGDEVSIKRW